MLAAGTWGPWQTLEEGDDEGPSAGTAEHASSRVATSAVWVGRATGYELRFPADATDRQVHLIQNSVRYVQQARVAAAAAAADAAPGMPSVHSRTEWGARAPKIHPAIGNRAEGVRMVVVHHTAIPTNNYTQAEVAEMVRGYQAYDMDVRHYDDLGYNVMIDKFGGIWEGRFGGLDQNVVGAQAKGFNEVSMGIAVIGNYVDVAAPQAVIDSVAALAGWKLTMEGYRPDSTITLTAGETEGHPAHPFPLVLPRIVGHTDVGQTQCPGRIWNALPEIRRKADLVYQAATGSMTVTADSSRTLHIETAIPEADLADGVRLLVDRRVVGAPSAVRRRANRAGEVSVAVATGALIGPHRVCAFSATSGVGRLIGCASTNVQDPGLNAIRPSRILDTRDAGQTALRGGEIRRVKIGGTRRVPINATAAAVNLTATGGSANGWLSIFPCTQAPGTTSNLNFNAKQTVAGLAFTQLDEAGTACISSNTNVDVVIDATAFFLDSTTFASIVPFRLLDTRTTGARLEAGVARRIPVRGPADLEPTATAAALNLTAVNPSRAGWLTLYPCDASPSGTSSLNFVAGQTVANLSVGALSADGSVCLLANVATDVVIDVAGSFPVGRFHPMTPFRLLDTRLVAKSRLTDDDTIELPVRGRAGIPADATAVFINLTAVGAKDAGYLSAYPCAELWPGTSSVNHDKTTPVANLTLTKIGINDCLRITNMSETDVIADVVGWVS